MEVSSVEKIFSILSSRHEKILKISNALQRLNFECKLFYADTFADCHSYLQKKLDNVLQHKLSADYLKKLSAQAKQEIAEYNPNKILFINSPLPEDTVQEIVSDGKPCYFYYVDPVEDVEKFKSKKSNCYIGLYDINSYKKLSSAGIKNVKFLPLGYNCDYENVPKMAKDIDIFWVGTPNKARLKILSAIAKKAKADGWIFQCYSPFWGWQYFWKKWIFQVKYPELYRCAVNQELVSKEVAEKYSRSCICLNIHNANIDSFNPRTYEILASGGFLLTDERKEYDGLVPGEDFACYSSVEDMIEKIEYYLNHNEEREQMVARGKTKIFGKRTVSESVRQLFEMCCDKH